MSRLLTNHTVNPANDKISIAVTDEPGAGGANHRYEITGFDTEGNPSSHYQAVKELVILFQNGPIPENGVNGITHEVLLAVIEDRLSSFQAGPYACEQNKYALDAVRNAQRWLHARTLQRMERGVEGTHMK